MNSIFFWLFVAYFLDVVQFQLTKGFYNNQWCTLGAFDMIIEGVADAPMVYRVLLPWFFAIIERIKPSLRKHRIRIYEIIKILVMGYSLYCVNLALGNIGAFIVTMLLPITFYFDYVDCYFELAAFASALTGNWQLTAFTAMLCAFERETAPLVAVTYFLATGDSWHSLIIMFIICDIMLIVRRVVGYHKLYCNRFMFKRNLKELRMGLSLKNKPLFIDYGIGSFLLCIFVLGLIIYYQGLIAWPIPVIVIILGYSMGVARETRIFMPIFLWIAMGLIK